MAEYTIAVATYVKPLLKNTKQTAKEIGVVECDMGDTSCKVPLANTYIENVEKIEPVGKKRKTIKC